MDHVGGGSTNDRIGENFYDWRNRLVASKQGALANAAGETDGVHRPIVYLHYDNLGEVTETDQYDGDQQTITVTTGMPAAPTSSLLRAMSFTSYDDQGRVYNTQVVSVDQGETGGTAGTVVSALSTNTFYDHRGDVAAVYAPGGLTTKASYDGAGRLSNQSQTDGGAMDAAPMTWTNATALSTDVVLSQMLYTYDLAGNVILTVDKERFDNDSTSSYGDLGGPATGVLARVYYLADYYDAANRLTGEANVGTNAGTAYTRPGTVPTRSDTVLVTSYTYPYGEDAIQSLNITGSPTGGTFKLIFGGQTTGTIAFNASASTVQTALTGLSSIGSSNASVAGSASAGYTVHFTGSRALTTESGITTTSAFTGGSSPAITDTVYIAGGSAGRTYSTTDPRGIVSKTDTDLMGRTVRTVDAFTDGVPSTADDQTTTYTYDGDGNVLTMAAVMPPGTVNQTTAYIYGIGTTIGTDIFSNDTVAKLEYPDKTTGAASTSAANDQTYTYNWQDDKATLTDQNGSVHAYSYDVLGRMTLDAVTTLGSGVDGTVRALGFNFDTGGRPYQATSYSSATTFTSGTTVNQVQDAYEGFGELAIEYQNQTGAVNTGTTSNVQYLYTEDAGVKANISSATESGNTVTITTSNAHHYSVGQTVTIAGVTVSGYNGTFTIASIPSSTTFTYTDSTGSLSSSSAGTASVAVNNNRMVGFEYPNGRWVDYLYGNNGYTLSGITRSGTTATATMGSNIYSVGSTVIVSGASDPLYNGTFIVTAVNTTSHTFSYTMSGTPSASASGTDLLVTTGATLDGSISRISAIMDQAGTSAGVHLEEYTYLGLATIVTMNRPEANEQLTYVQVTGDTLHGSDGGDRYTGLDRFGRVVDQYWLNTASSPNAIDRFQYAYDRDGNVLYKKNLLSTSFSELYHTNSAASGDDATAYDSLGRLTAMRRGTLSASAHNGGVLDTVTTLNSTTGVTGNQKAWTLNSVGGWSSVTTDGTATSHTNNGQNEITAVGATSQTYDNNGNVTKNSQAYNLTYDAWNRLMTSSNGTSVFGYDALGRFVKFSVPAGPTYFYYDMAGRMIENFNGTLISNQTVWGFGYINELILRDRHVTTGGAYGIASSGLDERLYANQDANWNTTSLYQTSGTPGVVQRIIYDAYGTPTLLTAAWASNSGSTLFFRTLYQGTYWLQNANVHVMGARDFDYTTGAWVQKDPSGYPDGMNSYQALDDSPISTVDPSGLSARDKAWRTFYYFTKGGGKDPKKIPTGDCEQLKKETAKSILAVVVREMNTAFYGNIDPKHTAGTAELERRVAVGLARIKCECGGGGGSSTPAPAPNPPPPVTPPVPFVTKPVPVVVPYNLPWFDRGGASVNDKIDSGTIYFAELGVMSLYTASQLASGGLLSRVKPVVRCLCPK